MTTSKGIVSVLRSVGMVMFAAQLFVAGAILHAQSFTVLHNFTGGGDGAYPYAGVTLDAAGNVYGTAYSGGYLGWPCDSVGGCGTVFKLSRGSNWTLNTLHVFVGYGSNDGANPQARVIFGPDGALYGTTAQGGQSGIGTVFRMTPQPVICRTSLCPWSETNLHSFTGGNDDGAFPAYGDLLFDHAGNLFGTTSEGGGGMCNDGTCGTVFQMTHAGGSWTESVIYKFANTNLGYWPYPGVILDNAGNLYGATTWNTSTVFELAPSGGGWTANGVYTFSNFTGDGSNVTGGLISDAAGNFYGTTSAYGPNNGGTVFELIRAGGQWTLHTLYAFSYSGGGGFVPPGPTSALLMDASGNLYGTTALVGAHGQGSVFKLTNSGGGWTLTTLHDFTGGSDGGQPWGQLAFDAQGNIYGTATIGGSSIGSCYQGQGCGVVFKITP